MQPKHNPGRVGMRECSAYCIPSLTCIKGDIVETVDKIIAVVQDLGFPVACVIALFWLLYKEMQDRKNRDVKFTELIERNTAAISSLESLVKSLHKEE